MNSVDWEQRFLLFGRRGDEVKRVVSIGNWSSWLKLLLLSATFRVPLILVFPPPLFLFFLGAASMHEDGFFFIASPFPPFYRIKVLLFEIELQAKRVSLLNYAKTQMEVNRARDGTCGNSWNCVIARVIAVSHRFECCRVLGEISPDRI